MNFNKIKAFIQNAKNIFNSYSTKRKVIYGGLGAVIMSFLAVIFLYQLVRLEIIDDLPSNLDLKEIENPLASEYYASGGELLGKYYIENRSLIDQAELSEYFVNALLATEDHRFYDHNGVDYRSLGRVAIKSILLQQNTGGGSTITQQLVKNLYPRKRYKLLSSVINKFREMIIAQRLEKIHSKEQLLLYYANTVSFGERAFGLFTASKRFFKKEPNKLLLEDAATLVGMLKATSYYNPRNYPERARDRRNVVLSQMAKYGYIKVKVAEELSLLPVRLNYQNETSKEEVGRYFKQYLVKEFKEWSLDHSKPDGSKYQIYRDGLKIYTSLDYKLQKVAENYMSYHMDRLQSAFEQSWKGGKMYGKTTRIIDDYIIKDPEYKYLKEQGATNEEALTQFTSQSSRKLWTWDGYINKNGTKIDSIKHYLRLLHAGILAAHPPSGEIKVWVGGNDFGRFQYDNVTARRQPGSTFKPIVYLAALEKGIGACDYFPNELRTYKSYQDWTPKNSSGKYGGYLSLNNALANSVNTVSAQVLFKAGIPAAVKTAKELGIESKLAEVPSIVLGTSDVSLFEMVGAYSVFANKGMKSPLRSIRRIEDRHGNILYDSKENKQAVKTKFKESNIKQINAMLAKVTEEGTGKRLYSQFNIPFSVKGKTGTTQNQSDGWFIGYTDNLIVGSWVGTEDRRIHFRNLTTGSGGRTALPLVGALFEYSASKGLRPYDNSNQAVFNCYGQLSDQEYAMQENGGNKKIEELRNKNKRRDYDDEKRYPDKKTGRKTRKR